jgi:hypothetical protein
MYNLFACFIEKYLTNYYHEDEFYSLQSSLALLNILFKYHDPGMYNIFEFGLITPEMYATSWILTIFAKYVDFFNPYSKTRLDILYKFWDLLILEDDEMFLHYFVIAFLQYNKNELISTDYSQIPSILSQLYLRSEEEVISIFNRAKVIRYNTPYTIRLFARRLEIFKPGSTKLKELFDKFEPENFLTMPILPSEVFNIAYNNIISCPDNRCSNFKNKYEFDRAFYDDQMDSSIFGVRQTHCYYCDHKVKKGEGLSYILLDLRISDGKSNEIKPGFLPMTVILDQKELLCDEVYTS